MHTIKVDIRWQSSTATSELLILFPNNWFAFHIYSQGPYMLGHMKFNIGDSSDALSTYIAYIETISSCWEQDYCLAPMCFLALDSLVQNC